MASGSENCEYSGDSNFAASSAQEMAKMERALNAGEETPGSFKGILLDTGCNRRSMISVQQLREYALMHRILPVIRSKKRRRIQGIRFSATTIGSAALDIPLPALSGLLKMLLRENTFEVVEEDPLPLLSLKDMMPLGFTLGLGQKCLGFSSTSASSSW